MSRVDKLAEEFEERIEEYETEARRERQDSVNWDLVKAKCNPRQVLAIQLFVEYRLFEGAASIAKMSVPDFMDLLQELKISMG
jgi:hypothetical protein